MIIDFNNSNAGKGSLRFDEPQELTDAQKLQALENLGIDPDAGFKVYVVDELPTEDIDTKAIYLVPSDDQEEGNYYDEFMYVDGNWEKVGSTKIDLSDYYTKEEVDVKTDIVIDEATWTVEQKIDVYNAVKNDGTKNYALITAAGKRLQFSEFRDGYVFFEPHILEISNGVTKQYWKVLQSNGHFINYNEDENITNNSTITIKQGDVEQSFTLNQSTDQTIELQQGGGGNEWFGTQREWDALGEYDADTTYYITDLMWEDIKNRPDMSKYATVAMLNDEVKTLDKKVAKKTELVYMTQDEFDAIQPLEGVTYCIEGEGGGGDDRKTFFFRPDCYLDEWGCFYDISEETMDKAREIYDYIMNCEDITKVDVYVSMDLNHGYEWTEYCKATISTDVWNGIRLNCGRSPFAYDIYLGRDEYGTVQMAGTYFQLMDYTFVDTQTTTLTFELDNGETYEYKVLNN